MKLLYELKTSKYIKKNKITILFSQFGLAPDSDVYGELFKEWNQGVASDTLRMSLHKFIWASQQLQKILCLHGFRMYKGLLQIGLVLLIRFGMFFFYIKHISI